jgi:hypothetical protein
VSLSAEISEHIVTAYLPGTSPGELSPSYDLIGNGVISSLQLIQFIEWLQGHYDIQLDDLEITPDNSRSVASSCAAGASSARLAYSAYHSQPSGAGRRSS